MLGIRAENANPNNFGFMYNSSTEKRIKKKVTTTQFEKNTCLEYFEIQNRFNENFSHPFWDEELAWFSNVDFINLLVKSEQKKDSNRMLCQIIDTTAEHGLLKEFLYYIRLLTSNNKNVKKSLTYLEKHKSKFMNKVNFLSIYGVYLIKNKMYKKGLKILLLASEKDTCPKYVHAWIRKAKNELHID